ncbi:MAG: response regulator [Planctomycetota bacterium]|nr:MAG: response regulator [Planctomycetota bacterium]
MTVNNDTDRRSLASKDVFTTGEAAEICRVSQQTIIRCFDKGKLKGFRVPGSRFRRIPRAELIRFMRDNDIPLDALRAGKTRLLVVDDDPDILDLLKLAVDRDGRFEARFVSTGYRAGVETQAFLPDVILLDYMLPDINGDDVLRAVRDNPSLAHTRVLFVSGVIRQDDVARLLALGAEDVVHKPFDVKALLQRCADLVQA